MLDFKSSITDFLWKKAAYIAVPNKLLNSLNKSKFNKFKHLIVFANGYF